MSPEELEQAAIRLDELCRLIIQSYIDWNPEMVATLAGEFASTKRSVQTHLIENPTIQLSGTSAAKARAVLATIAEGKTLPAEDALIGKIVDCGFDDVDFDEIGTNELYSWMSHIEYAEGLWRAGALVYGCEKLPKHLSKFIDEARQCFAFQQYNAVFALCRTIVEISVRDVAISRNILPSDYDNIVHLVSRGEKTLSKLITEVTMAPELSHLKDQLHNLRISGNSIVHGNASVSRDDALATLQRTLRSVHELYEATSSGA